MVVAVLPKATRSTSFVGIPVRSRLRPSKTAAWPFIGHSRAHGEGAHGSSVRFELARRVDAAVEETELKIEQRDLPDPPVSADVVARWPQPPSATGLPDEIRALNEGYGLTPVTGDVTRYDLIRSCLQVAQKAARNPGSGVHRFEVAALLAVTEALLVRDTTQLQEGLAEAGAWIRTWLKPGTQRRCGHVEEMDGRLIRTVVWLCRWTTDVTQAPRRRLS